MRNLFLLPLIMTSMCLVACAEEPNVGKIAVETSEVKKRLLLHCNWGWRDSDRNGYFSSQAFNATAGPTEKSEFQPETRGNGDKNYTWWFRIVTYKKPK